MLLAATLLFATTSSAAAAPAPQPAASVIAVARARILRPVQVTRTGDVGERTASLVTHQRPRRDGALVVDCY